MSYVLAVYSTKAFKEYLLPAVDNADFSLALPNELFGLTEDIELKMEIIDGNWKFLRERDYQVYYTATKEEYKDMPLKDGNILSLQLGQGEQISIIVKETDSSFNVYEKFSLENVNELTIGKEEDNIFCFDNSGLISRKHACIVRKGNQFIVEDSSSNGVFINGRRVMGAWQLNYGDCIDIFGLRLVYLDKFLAVNTVLNTLKIKENVLSKFQIAVEEPVRSNFIRDDRKKLFHRSPRNIPKIETEKIEIEAPPAPKELNMQPAFLSIGPSLTMALPMLVGCALSIYSTRVNGGAAGAFMYTGLVTSIGSALIGSIWSIVNMRQAKKKNREEELKRFEAYSEYLIACANEIKARYENNICGMRELYQEAAKCCEYDINSIELWNKNSRHEDFLCQRLGIGNLPFQVDIDIPKERFNLINDSLAEKPKMIKESYKMLNDVPVCVDLLKHKLIGVIGGDKKRGCYPVVYDLVAQIAAGNCYTDIKLIFIYDETQDAGGCSWKFARWLPHVWSEDKKTRFVAGNKNEASEVLYEVTKALRIREEERRAGMNRKREMEKPYYILFLENPDLLEGELIAKYIFDSENNCGITTIMMAVGYEELPNTCEYIIENTIQYTGMYGVADGVDDKIRIKYDLISNVQLETFARRMSGIEVNEIETGGELPNVLTFFDMYGVNHLEEFDVVERWKKNRTYDSIKALVGQKAGGVDCYLDVHEKYHGPHGLVAGTTGSGKSETLQTYILSLALNYSPDDIGFFVIDYKGGGMANLFNGLPHMIGQISNLSGNQVRRAMVSIKSENLRRQRIFNEHGVNNINLYTRLYKNKEAAKPVPHMFIIIDEFAELKREEPEFMRELISVAQVGRSLGVHLILATQKPSGTVDENIWSNSKFRLCLRVQDRQDSTDMLHRPDAAYITQAGRCYLQVGNDELFELFQSAWSGAAYDKNAGSVQTDIAQMLSENGKAAVIGSYAQFKQKEKMKKDWITQLIQILKKAADIENINVTDCMYDHGLSMKIVKKFFTIAEEQNIEYSKSDYNVYRVQDLIQVYARLLNDGCAEINAENLIASAAEEGRKLPEMKEKTQLDAVVEYLAKLAEENGYVHNLRLWLPVLPTELYLMQLKGYQEQCFNGTNWTESWKGFSLETMVGLYDDPVNQDQGPFTVDLAAEGNQAIVGTVVSGKSTFLMTYLFSLVNKYSPDVVNLYILDYSSKMLGCLEDLVHVGGVMFENDHEKVSKFFNMLEGILAERKKMFKGGNYIQYTQANGLVVPAIVIAIDNMGAFRNKTNNMYEEMLMMLLKEGVGYGIYVVVTAAGFGMSEIPNRMSDSFRSVICLEMNDKYAYTDALRTLHLDVLPEENVKGRGLAKIGESVLEFQTALPLQAEDDYKRGKLIKKRCEEMNAAWSGKCAKQIPEIPEKPVWDVFSQLEEVRTMVEEGIRLPIGYDKKNATVYGIDLRRTYTYLIAGKGRSGKTNMLRIAMKAAHMMGGEIAVVDFAGDLKTTADIVGGEYINSTQELFDYFMKISPKFKERNVAKKTYVESGISDEEIFSKMQQFKKIFIFIEDLTEFVSKVHKPEEGIQQMAPFVSTLLEKGAMHNVFWFAELNKDDAVKVAGMSVYNLFIRGRKGAYLGGNTGAQSILPFDHIPYTEQNKSQKIGIALLATHDEDETTTLVLPKN